MSEPMIVVRDVHRTYHRGGGDVHALRGVDLTVDAGQLVAQEYAVLDRVGRLQLPRDFTSALDLDRRVRLELEADHIGVWPDRQPPPTGDRGRPGVADVDEEDGP